MSLSEVSGGSSSPESVALGEVLSFFGTVADYAAGAAPEDGERIAALAVGMARLAALPDEDCDALFFAARLRKAGALSIAKSPRLGDLASDRELMIAQWDVPPHGARICERIAALPKFTADIVRWQAECWDGTGYPDQLRWSGIPKMAQLLNIAATYVATPDPAEGLSTICSGSGRAFAPEQTRTFVMWFHTFGGEIEGVEPPYNALQASRTAPADVIELLSELVDAHNGAPGRAARIARRSEDIGRAMGLQADEMREVTLASLLFGIGELRANEAEASQFDALARLGVASRAENAAQAAALIQRCAFLKDIAPAVRSRGEWYDGTGAPAGLRHDAIPLAARVLSLSIAYDAIDEAYRTRITEERTTPIARIETASGTQFDPQTVRALSEVLKTHA